MLRAIELYKTYENGFPALRGLSLLIEPGSWTGLTGESGSGKSTLARLLCCLEPCDRGRIELDGRPYTPRSGASLREFRRQVQIVFQDSSGSLDPRMSLGRSIAEPLDNFDPLFRRASRKARFLQVGELLERVGLAPDHARRYPHELSGGQRQRGAIARALAVKPRYLLCDEVVSSLDPENRDRILELLMLLQGQTGMGCLFISHDPVLSSRMSDCIYTMEGGKIAETCFPRERSYA